MPNPADRKAAHAAAGLTPEGKASEKLSLSSPTGTIFGDPSEEQDFIKWLSQHFILRSEYEYQAGVGTEHSFKHHDTGEEEAATAQRSTWVLHQDDGHGSLAEHALEESVWDAMFFVGMQETGTLGSMLTAFALVVNIFLQVIFLLVISNKVVEKNFTDNELKGLAAWRNQVGHDMKYVSSLNGFSLVDRVCARDPTLEVATDLLHTMGAIEEYLPRDDMLFQGPTMCIVACAIWTLVCLKEVSATLDLMRAVARLPVVRGRRSAFSVTEEGGIELRHVNPYRKLAVFAVAVIRLSVVGALFFIGLKYLAHTVSIPDLILNAAALELVMTIDELVFAAMMPARVAALTRTLVPLPMLPWRECRGANVKSMLAPIILVASLLFLWYGELRTSIRNINEARDTLCNGNRSFGFEKDGLEVVRVTALNAFNLKKTLDLSDMDSMAVRDVWQPLSAAGPSWQFGLPSTMESEAPVIIQDMDHNSIQRMMATVKDVYGAALTSLCRDSPQQFWRVAQWHLAKSLGIPGPLTNCSQVQRYCRLYNGQTLRSMVMLRALCPHTCGCNSLLSGTIFTSQELGCPVQCLFLVEPEERYAVPCHDVNVSDPEDPRSLAVRKMVAETKSHLYFLNLDRMLENLGCGMIDFLRTPPRGMEAAVVDLCDSADGNLHYARYGDGNPVRGRTVKLMTLFCPRTCNCDGHSSTLKRPPAKFCPDSCRP